MSEPSIDFLLHLNEPSFRVPLELYKKNLKDINKLNDKQFITVNKELSQYEAAFSPEEKINRLECLISNLESYQHKLEDKLEFESNYNERLEKRLDKYTQLSEFKKGNFNYGVQSNKKNFLINKVPDSKQLSNSALNFDGGSHKTKCEVTVDNSRYLNNWFKDQINVSIAHYLLKTSDYNDAPPGFLKKPINFHNLDDNSEAIKEYVNSKPALLYLRNFNNADFVDYELIIRSNLISHDTLIDNFKHNMLSAWVKENEKFLRKIQSNLKFEFLLSTYIELIKDSVLKNENIIDISDFSNRLQNENNYIEALIFMKSEILPVNKDENNKYIDEIKIAMGLLAVPNSIILLFLKYEQFLIKHYYKKKFLLKNLDSSIYSLNQYKNFKILVNKEVLIKFLNQFAGSKQLKLTYKKYLFDKNLFKYFKLLSFKRFNYINDIFKGSIDQLYSISNNGSSFEAILSLGLSVLRTRNCITPNDLKKASSQANFDSLNLNIANTSHAVHASKHRKKASSKLNERLVKIKSKHCAICSSLQLIKLSNQIVFSHHSKSKLGYRNPIILPNDNIYDRDDLFKFNEQILVAFKNQILLLDKNQLQLHEEHQKCVHSGLINDYSNYFACFKDYLARHPESSKSFLADFDKIVDPLTGEFFTKDQCNEKVFPT